MTPERRVIALLISLFGLGGYALVLRGATFEGRDELQVVVVPPARGAGASGASGASRAAPWRARLVVPSARSRVGLWVDGRSCSAPEGPLPGGPGLHLARWSSTHLGRRPRSVGWAYRVLGAQPGPSGFLPAAATVTISQEQLDGPAGDDVASALSRVVRRILRDALATRTWIERQAVTLLLGSLRDLRVSTRVVSGGLRLRAAATFAYGAHRLTVVAATSMEVVARGGQLHLASRPVGVKILGREALGGWRKVGAGIAHVVLSRAVPPLLRRAVDRLLPRAEAILSAFLSQRFVVVARDPGLHLAVRPRRVEASPGRWIRVTFDLRLRDDRGVILPPASLVTSRTVAPPKTGRPGVEVTLHVDAINAALVAYWRSGWFDRLGAQGAAQARENLDPKLARLLAFDVRSTRLVQSPMLMPGSDVARLVLGPLRLSIRPLASARLPAVVDLYGRLPARLGVRDGAIVLRLAMRPVVTSCGEGTVAHPLHACFSEILGLANRWLARRRAWRIFLGPGPGWNRWSLAMPQGRLVARGRLRRAYMRGDRVVFGGWVSMKSTNP